jgi:hypothetical protein
MPAMRCACPKCQQALQIAQALPARFECPRCKARFVVENPLNNDKANLIRRDRDAVRRSAGIGNGAAGGSPIQMLRQGPAPTPLVVATGPSGLGQRGDKSGKGLALLIGSLLLAVGSVVLIVMLNQGHQRSPQGEQGAEAAVITPALSEHERKVNDAVNRGVTYLRNQILNPGGKEYYFADPGAGSVVGVWALAGLTLLECGVPSSDAAVEKVRRRVREETARLTFTYSVALCILFLDRLNQDVATPDPSNREQIQRLAVQMMAAQNANGGWGYYCPLLTAEQYETTMADLKTERFRPGRFAGTYDDNSINQFATLALWSARKHGIKTEPALAMVERRYRQNQNEDGSWGYRARDNGYLKDATTCAGLIGLAVGQGIRDVVPAARMGAKGALDPTKDPYIARGLAFVAKAIGKDARRMPLGAAERRRKHTADMMALNKQWQEAPESERPMIKRHLDELDDAQKMRGTYFNADSWGDLYFLWSVERVAVVFDLKAIEGKDWYDWGAAIILAHQQKDGSWRDRFPGIPDTCFALLFLKRVNFTKDLTDKFRLTAGGLAIGPLPPGRSGEIPPPAPRRE